MSLKRSKNPPQTGFPLLRTPKPDRTLDRLYGELGYEFADKKVVQQALTHRSVGNPHNERLEFLGDSILNFLVAEELFQRFPDAREGELTRLRATQVKGDTLASLARELGLGRELRLGSGELKSGGRDRESILADALEALIGAIFLDGELEDCRKVVRRIYETRFASLSSIKVSKDPKTRLQEWQQSRRMPLPEYAVVSVEGDSHNQLFTVSCMVAGLDHVSSGHGGSRRKAEQDAALNVLELLAVKQG